MRAIPAGGKPWLRRWRPRIAARLFLAVGLPTAVVVVALGVLAWRTTRQAVEASLQRELQASVAVAASTIPTLALRVLLPEDEATSSSYRRMVGRLRAIQQSTGSVRVLVVDGDEKVRASADPALHIGDQAPRVALDRVELSRAVGGDPAVSVPFTAKDGKRYMAAYARIPEDRGGRDDVAEGPPLVLAMEAPAAALDATDAVARQIAGLVGLAVLSVISLALVVARTITRPLRGLADEAERLGRGDLSSALDLPRGDDEVAGLGRTLEAMRKALVDRDAERQMMLAGIAHEVRNPLGGMELFSGLLEEGIAELPADAAPAPEARAELLEQAGRVRKELRYLTDVVSSFLAFARDTPLTKEPVDVPALLDDVASLCRREGAAAIVVEAAGAGAAELDRARIKQALLNLVDNALAATGAGGTVTVRAHRVPGGGGGGGALVLEVVDTGKGMEAATLERVWTPFFTTKEKGSGLGLPLVRKLARDHGGDAAVTSSPGAGTTVRITLPA